MRKTLSLALVLALVGFGSAQAGMTANIDYVGFGWENNDFPPSNNGDQLSVNAVATAIDPEFDVDLSQEEVTVHITALVSTGENYDPGSGWTFIGYAGGTIDVYADDSFDADWGTFPPNGQSGSFTNGRLLLSGEFTDFTLIVDGQGAGAFEGNIDGVGGSVANVCQDCEYTFGGAFTKEGGAQLPDGYHLQIDGILEVDSAVSSQPSSFGAVKALY